MRRFDPQPVRPLWWDDGAVVYIDQRRLPHETELGRAADVRSALEAIRSGAVGSGGCLDPFAGFGIVLARRDAPPGAAAGTAAAELRSAASAAGARRFELFDRVAAAAPGTELTAALAALDEHRRVDDAIADHAQRSIRDGGVMTYGGSGALATGGSGTAAGAIVAALRAGRTPHAYVGETRPTLTGARLTAYELRAAGVPCTVFSDAAAPTLLGRGQIGAVIVGAHAIGRGGDVVAELGTFALALAAAHHRIPFYVAAPRAAIDPAVDAGSTAAASGTSDAAAPAFDVTPGRLVTSIFTEYGPLRPPYLESLETLASRPHFAFVRSAADRR